MKTAGIDLSVQPQKTATCVITWSTTPVGVELFSALPDAELVEVVSGAVKVGVDCPFGWPEPFVVAVSDFAAGGAWPPPDDVLGLDRFALRNTDLVVKKRFGLRPLSVAADRIGRTAMHWASLQKGLGSIDRTGRSGLVTEVYPAATLKRWGLLVKGLKGDNGVELRRSALDGIERGIPIRLDGDVRGRCAQNDDAFDAFICALTARAVAVEQTYLPDPGEEERRARIEGWIHVPSVEMCELSARVANTPARASPKHDSES